MSQIGSVDSGSQALSLAANAEAGNTRNDPGQLGLPPFRPAGPAAAGAVDASLVSSQWVVGPAAIAGAYGGNAFSSGNLLPLLHSLTRSDAEQALALIGISTPKAGSSGSAASSSAAAAAAFAQLADPAASDSTPVVVDPLWGRLA